MFCYPFLVYWGLSKDLPNYLAYGAIFIGILRLFLAYQSTQSRLTMSITGAILILLGSLVLILGKAQFFLIYPIVTSLIFLYLFASSLQSDPCFIERIAARFEKNITPEKRHYMRAVTKIWCIFFIINALISFATIFISLQVWTFYNGFLSYVFIGLLFAGEFLYRYFVVLKR